MQRITNKPLFDLGRLVATSGALAALEKTGQHAVEFLARHVTGDWGELPVEDGGRKLSLLATGLPSSQQLPNLRGRQTVGHHRSRPLRDHPSASRRILIPFLARAVRKARPASSTQLSYASLQHNGRFLLPCGELLRPFAIDINTFESLIVEICDRHHPMMVFAALIFSVVRDPAFGHGSSPMGGTIVVRPAHSGCGFLESSRVRLRKAHGHAGDTSDDVRLLRIRKSANLAARVGIRNRE
jgi:hypothetical protein